MKRLIGWFLCHLLNRHEWERLPGFRSDYLDLFKCARCPQIRAGYSYWWEQQQKART